MAANASSIHYRTNLSASPSDTDSADAWENMTFSWADGTIWATPASGAAEQDTHTERVAPGGWKPVPVPPPTYTLKEPAYRPEPATHVDRPVPIGPRPAARAGAGVSRGGPGQWRLANLVRAGTQQP